MELKIKVIVVTYGSGTPLKDCYSIVEGETYTDCRKEIFQITEGKYSMDYPYEQYASRIEEYNLKQVPLQPHRENIMDIKINITDDTLYKMSLPFKFIHKLIIEAMGFSKEEDCYGVWYHGITPNTKEPSELLAVFDTEIKAQQYVENIKTYKKGYCFIVKSKYYK